MKKVYEELSEHLQVIGEDADRYSEALEELRLHSAIINNLTEGIYLISMDDGRIVYTNSRFEEMFGYGPGEMLGKHVSIVNAPTDKDPETIARIIMAELKTTGHWQGEIKNLKKDGAEFWCYASTSVFHHKKYGDVFVAIHTDITARKLAEEKSRKLLDELPEALQKIRTLKGLIPICASCKKIRDGNGNWHKLENYISEYTGASFSHGCCPECYNKISKGMEQYKQ